MNRQGKTLFILLVVLLALVGSWFLIRNRNQEREEREALAETADDTLIYEVSANEIIGFSYQTADGTVSFSKTDDTWKNNEDENMEPDQDAVQSYAGQLTSFTAKRVLSGEEVRYEEYGFEEPVNVIEVTTADGTDKLTFGMKNTVTGQYYVTLNDRKEEVFCVETSVPEQMNRTAESFEKEEEETQEDTEPEQTE